MKKSAIAVLLLVFPLVANATIRNVPADYPTIQAALNASVGGDEVVVAPGAYPENLVLTAAHSGVVLRSSGGAAATTIDGGLVSHVVKCTDVGALTRIDGFTITRGKPWFALGGGFYFINSSPTVQNCIVTGNEAVGAGFYLNMGSSPIIVDNEIYGNQAPSGSGGGIYADNSSSPRIERNIIRNNSCAAYGGGLVTGEFCNAVIVNNEIHHNTASLEGGGAWITRQADVLVQGNRFYQNVAPGAGAIKLENDAVIVGNEIFENRASVNNGGGIGGGGEGIIRDNVMWFNLAHSAGGALALEGSGEPGIFPTVEGNTIVHSSASVGGGIYSNQTGGVFRRNIVAFALVGGGIRAFGPLTLECNDVWQNAGGNYQIIGDQTGLNGNISVDPLFCNVLSHDLHLYNASPCTQAKSPCDLLIGALGPACGPLATKRATLGQMKGIYR